MKLLSKTLTILALAATTTSAFASYTEVLGKTYLYQGRYGNDKDIIHVNECGVQKVKLSVFNNDADVDHILATFRNGERQKLHVRNYFREGSSSRWIDLKGNKRCLQKIKIIGNAIGGSPLFDQSLIRVTGLFGVTTAPRNKVVKLGQKRIKLPFENYNNSRYNQQSINVKATQGDRQRCGIRMIRLLADNGRYKVKSFRVTFDNNSTQYVSFRDGFFYKGDNSRWVDLNGRRRCIKKVEFKALSPNGARMILQGKK